MTLKLKPLDRQVVVITGATSGIGLSTARAAAARGATLMLAARNEEALKSVCDDLASKGAKTAYVVADVGVEADVRAIAAAAVARFGGFDTWVNDAGVSIFGEIAQTPIEDQRRLFETNYWGVVYGSLIAVEHFRERPGGGEDEERDPRRAMRELTGGERDRRNPMLTPQRSHQCTPGAGRLGGRTRCHAMKTNKAIAAGCASAAITKAIAATGGRPPS